jgi:hypothetical protein
MYSGDFDLCVDAETEKGYFIFDHPHFEVVTATLTDDYTGVTGEHSAHYRQLYPPFAREAPTHFTRNGRHYLFTSGTTGYWPNPSKVAVFSDFHGEYTDLGDPHIGDKTGTSFSSQITCVLKIPGKDLYVVCADRWKPGKLNTWKAMQFQKFVEKAMKNPRHRNMMTQDASEEDVATLPGKKRRFFDNTSIADYVWLPVEWQGEKPVIRWRDEWRIEDF